MTPAYDEALKWLDRGIATIPIQYRSKSPDYTKLRRVGAVEHRNGKEIGVWRPYQTRLPTLDELKTWFTSRFVNIAVVTGWQGLVGFDFDCMSIYEAWRNWALDRGGDAAKLATSYEVRTGKPGIHKYAFLEEPPDRTIKIYDDPSKPARERQTIIDVKAAGGICITAPSIHPSNTPYKAISKAEIQTVESVYTVFPDFWHEQAGMIMRSTVVANPVVSTPWAMSSGGKVQWIKSQYKILSFFPDAVQSGSHWYKTLCPFHNDNHESFWIDIRRERCGCQACINGSMDVIDLYARLHNLTLREAIKEMI